MASDRTTEYQAYQQIIDNLAVQKAKLIAAGADGSEVQHIMDSLRALRDSLLGSDTANNEPKADDMVLMA